MVIRAFYKTRIGHDPVAAHLLTQFQQQFPALTGLRIEQVLRVEKDNITPEDIAKLKELFCYPGAENLTFESGLNQSGPVKEVCYQRAWTDPEWPSIQHAAEALNLPGLEWARLAFRYQFVGVDEATAQRIVEQNLFNEQSQVILGHGEIWTTLKPQGFRGIQPKLDISIMDQQKLADLSQRWRLFLSPEQLIAIRDKYKSWSRISTRAEIEMIAAYWSDHCAHTSWKALGLLQDLQESTRIIKHPLVMSAYVDNSGVMRFYGGWALNIKGETHISPFLAGPYGAILTLHGGVERDPMGTGLGAWPFMGTAIFAIRDPRMGWEALKGTIHPRILLREAIRGTRDYVNPMGIRMAWSQFLVHPRNTKAFALGHSVGILPEWAAKKGKPHVGDLLFLIGGLTGRDGLKGAVVSSDFGSTDTLTIDAAHVQIGMPIVQRIFMEAIPVLRDRGCIRAITDLGAAGLSCGTGEMGAEVLQFKYLNKKTVKKIITSGVWVNLAWVMFKCQGMDDWEIWLSESQERMVIAVPREKYQEAKEILDDYGVNFSVIGIFSDTEHCQVIYDENLKQEDWLADPHWNLTVEPAVNLPYSFLTGECPLPRIEIAEPIEKPKPFVPPRPFVIADWIQLISNVLGHFNLSDQSKAAHQFDQTVGGGTIFSYLGGHDERMPDELCAVTPVLGKRWTAGLAVAVNQTYGEIDPAQQGWLVYAQAIAKLVAGGFSPKSIVCNANVYTPKVTDSPENAWRLVRLVRDGYSFASRKFKIPVISGKDSSSGTYIDSDGVRTDAPLTFAVAALGAMPYNSRLIPKAFAKPGDTLVLYVPGIKNFQLGGSILADLYGERGDRLSELDLDEVLSGWERYHQMLKTMQWGQHVHSRSVVESGGVIRRLFEMAWGSKLGCEIFIDYHDPLEFLFSELNTCIIFATDRRHYAKILSLNDFYEIGTVTRNPEITVYHDGRQLFGATPETLSLGWQQTFAEVA